MATGLTQNEKLILSSIDDLRKKRNKRPDKEGVSLHASTKHGLGMEEALKVIDSLIDEKVIEIKKTDKGKDSFYISNSINGTSNDISRKSKCEQEVKETVPQGVDKDPSLEDRLRNPNSTSPHVYHQKALSGNDLSHAISQMASTINNLNNLLQIERLKSDKLLTENFELKLRNKDLENEIQRMHYSPNNTTSLSESKAFEIRTDLVTHARTTSPAPINNNNIIRSQAKTLPSPKQQIQHQKANNGKNNTNKKN